MVVGLHSRRIGKQAIKQDDIFEQSALLKHRGLVDFPRFVSVSSVNCEHHEVRRRKPGITKLGQAKRNAEGHSNEGC